MRQRGVDTLITEEPDDRIGHVRICGGDGQQWLSLPGARRHSGFIQLLRYGRKPGDPGRELIEVGPIVWKFPQTE